MKWPRQPILPQNSAFFWMTTVNFLLWIKLVIKLENITSQRSFSFSTSRLLLHHHQLSLRIFFFSLEKIHLWLLSVWINTSRINKINAKANKQNNDLFLAWKFNWHIFWRKMSVPIGNPCDMLPKNVSKFHSNCRKKIVLDLKTWKLASCGKEIPPCFLLHAIFFFSRKFLRALITTYTGLEKEPRSLEGSKPSSSRLTCNHEPRLLTRTKLLVSARCCAAQL